MQSIITRVVSWSSLALLILFPLLYLAGTMGLESVKLGMLVMTVVWFIATPMWMWNADEAGSKS